MTLSERIAAGEASTELDEAIARAMEWTLHGCNEAIDWIYLWKREGDTPQGDCPSYRTDIRLTLAEIKRQRFGIAPLLPVASNVCSCEVIKAPWVSFSATRTDRNLDLAALEALLKAMGE